MDTWLTPELIFNVIWIIIGIFLIKIADELMKPARKKKRKPGNDPDKKERSAD